MFVRFAGLNKPKVEAKARVVAVRVGLIVKTI